jgi:hypothetical protein
MSAFWYHFFSFFTVFRLPPRRPKPPDVFPGEAHPLLAYRPLDQ